MKLTLESSNIQKDVSLRLRFRGGAWATMTFIYFEENQWWQVSINSDWGNWQYSWSKSGMGTDVFSFFSEKGNAGYLSGKFTGAESQVFDAKKSAVNLRRNLREVLNYWDDRELYSEIMLLTKELEELESPDEFMSRAHSHELIGKSLGHFDFWLFLEMKTHPRTKFFFSKVFPLLLSQLRKKRASGLLSLEGVKEQSPKLKQL